MGSNITFKHFCLTLLSVKLCSGGGGNLGPGRVRSNVFVGIMYIG